MTASSPSLPVLDPLLLGRAGWALHWSEALGLEDRWMAAEALGDLLLYVDEVKGETGYLEPLCAFVDRPRDPTLSERLAECFQEPGAVREALRAVLEVAEIQP